MAFLKTILPPMMVASTRMSLILSGEMRVIGAIEDEVVIKKILKHLG
jgi:hypothetical protein